MFGNELPGCFEAGFGGPIRSEEPILEANGLGRKGLLQPLDLDVRPGEVVGLAGLLGSGRTETARLLFGVDRPDQGTIRISHRAVRLNSPWAAIRYGIALTPEDRKVAGIIPNLTVRENIILALQGEPGELETPDGCRAGKTHRSLHPGAWHQDAKWGAGHRKPQRWESAKGPSGAVAGDRAEAVYS